MSSPGQLMLVTHEYLPKKGGIAVYCHELALAANACRYQVEVWAPNKAVHGIDDASIKAPFPVASLPNAGTHGPLSIFSTARVLSAMGKRLSEAHVCLLEPGPIYAAMWLEYLKGIQAKHLSLVLHGSEILKIGCNARRMRLFRSLLKRVNRVGVVSEHNKHKAIELLAVPEEKLVLVPGAVRHVLTSGQPAFELKPTEGARRLVLLTLARVHPRKGQHAVLEALKRLPEAIRNQLEYRVAGPVVDVAYQRELERLASDCGVLVRFLGELPDGELTEQLHESAIFIMTPQPYKQSVEGFGMVYLEAGACGVPSIAHDIGGVADAVRHNDTGILTPPGDMAALAEAITRLVEDAQLRRQMGEAARARAGEHSWEDNVRLLFEKD